MLNEYAVNARFVTQPVTGVQRYCYELSQHLRRGELLSPAPATGDYQQVKSRVRVTGGPLAGHAWEQLVLPLAVPRGQPLLSPAGCGPIGHANQAIVIHDTAVLENPEWYSRAYALWHARLLPVLAKRVRRIIAVSEFCKSRVVELLGVPECRVEVALEAASACFFPRNCEEIRSTARRLGVVGPYFLAVGAVSPRKNFGRLLAAWRGAQNRLTGVGLVVVGKEGLRFSGNPTIGELPRTVTHLRRVTDAELAALYSGALGLLYPSLHEGFGLPILEAMACGCPVLTSDRTAMPEVAGDAAILVNPAREECIEEGIIQLSDGRRAAELKVRGFLRSRQFSWARAAEVAERATLN